MEGIYSLKRNSIIATKTDINLQSTFVFNQNVSKEFIGKATITQHSPHNASD